MCDKALQGPATFSQHASAIAPLIQDLRDQPKSQGIFLHRLMFVVRYARFHQLLEGQELQDAALDLVAMFREDLAPKSWWPILLCDSVQLLQYSTYDIVSCAVFYSGLPQIYHLYLPRQMLLCCCRNWKKSLSEHHRVPARTICPSLPGQSKEAGKKRLLID